MKWTPEMEQDLKESYLNVSDKEFGKRYGLSSEAVRGHRSKMMNLKKQTYRQRLDLDSLVIQITNWLLARADVENCISLLRQYNIAYGVACNKKSKYAVFRQETDTLRIGKYIGNDGCEKSWCEIWTPGI